MNNRKRQDDSIVVLICLSLVSFVSHEQINTQRSTSDPDWNVHEAVIKVQ